MFGFRQFRVFALFITVVLYIISFLCYNSICIIWGKCSYEHFRYNIISIMWPPPILVAFFILWAAYFPYADGVPCRWRWYKFLLYLCLNGLRYRQAWQYPFQFRKTPLRTGGVDYVETPFADLHLLPRTKLSFPARCLCGLWVYPSV